MTYDVKSPMAVAAQKFSDDVKEASDGRLVINLFTNSALGSETDSYIAVAGDELEMTCAGVQGTGCVCTKIQLFISSVPV